MNQRITRPVTEADLDERQQELRPSWDSLISKALDGGHGIPATEGHLEYRAEMACTAGADPADPADPAVQRPGFWREFWSWATAPWLDLRR